MNFLICLSPIKTLIKLYFQKKYSIFTLKYTLTISILQQKSPKKYFFLFIKIFFKSFLLQNLIISESLKSGNQF